MSGRAFWRSASIPAGVVGGEPAQGLAEIRGAAELCLLLHGTDAALFFVLFPRAALCGGVQEQGGAFREKKGVFHQPLQLGKLGRHIPRMGKRRAEGGEESGYLPLPPEAAQGVPHTGKGGGPVLPGEKEQPLALVENQEVPAGKGRLAEGVQLVAAAVEEAVGGFQQRHSPGPRVRPGGKGGFRRGVQGPEKGGSALSPLPLLLLPPAGAALFAEKGDFLHFRPEAFRTQGLENIFEHPGFQRFLGILELAIGTVNHRDAFRHGGADPSGQLHAIAQRHDDVGENHVHGMRLQKLLGCAAVTGLGDVKGQLIFADQAFDALPFDPLIVYNQHFVGFCHVDSSRYFDKIHRFIQNASI